jgi:hypothetical protein
MTLLSKQNRLKSKGMRGHGRPPLPKFDHFATSAISKSVVATYSTGHMTAFMKLVTSIYVLARGAVVLNLEVRNMLHKTIVGTFSALFLVALSGGALAQGSAVDEFGDVPGVQGKAEATITVEKGNFATLFATARVFGGKPVGPGVLTRAGVGVDIFVNDKICSSDRDVRRRVDVATFEGKFASSTTCMTVLKAGTHVVLAERSSVNVEGAKLEMKYSVFGGQPSKLNVPSN